VQKTVLREAKVSDPCLLSALKALLGGLKSRCLLCAPESCAESSRWSRELFVREPPEQARTGKRTPAGGEINWDSCAQNKGWTHRKEDVAKPPMKGADGVVR